MSDKTYYMPDQDYAYYKQVAVRDQEILRALREETAKLNCGNMQISPEQGQLMQWLVSALKFKHIIEIGTFTGYSTLCMALSLPKDGHIIACDTSEEWTAVAKKYWQQAGIADKIELCLAPAIDTLQPLISTQTNRFDFIFIDADKEGYDRYYEAALKLLKPGGVIGVDNVLGIGRWLASDPNATSPGALAIKALNQKILQDSRVEMCMLPIGDGLTLARKL